MNLTAAEKYEKVTAYLAQNGGTASNACTQLGIRTDAYYTYKSKHRTKAPKVQASPADTTTEKYLAVEKLLAEDETMTITKACDQMELGIGSYYYYYRKNSKPVTRPYKKREPKLITLPLEDDMEPIAQAPRVAATPLQAASNKKVTILMGDSDEIMKILQQVKH